MRMPVRALWLTLGLFSTACGIAGVVVPLVPTTPSSCSRRTRSLDHLRACTVGS